MNNDPTITGGGDGDLGKGPRTRPRSGAPFAGMLGEGAEEQIGHVGEEAQQAFSAAAAEARSFTDKSVSALTDKVNAVKDQVQQSTQVLRDQAQKSGQAARDWAMKQADSAKQLQSDKPMLVLSVSAGAALAVGLVAGFVIGRVTADDY
jgi:ElaB/YqjD/DUF883 family membrane-anchored ribosome-binding protein